MILSYSRAKADSFAPPFPDTAIPSSQSWALEQDSPSLPGNNETPRILPPGAGYQPDFRSPTSSDFNGRGAEGQRGRGAGHFFPDFRLDVLTDAGIHLTTASF